MVTHDKSVFYANDGNEKGWIMPGEMQLKPKSQGLSIMVSEFQCPCHSTMRYTGVTSRTLFYAGANREGYWTSDDLVKQLKEQVIPIFNGLHPGCKGLFLSDQSANHKAYASDALVAARMTLHPKKYRLYKGEQLNYHFRILSMLAKMAGEQVSHSLITAREETLTVVPDTLFSRVSRRSWKNEGYGMTMIIQKVAVARW